MVLLFAMEDLKILPLRDWKASLEQIIRTPSRPQIESRQIGLVVVGVGQELRGDDGAGILAVRLLGDIFRSDPEKPLLVEAGNAPENVLGQIIRHEPDVVIFIDAAFLGAEPGTIRLLPGAAAESLGVGTHTLPLATLAGFITTESAAAVYVLAIQPETTAFNTTISPRIRHGVEEICEVLSVYWRKAVMASSANTAGGFSVVST